MFSFFLKIFRDIWMNRSLFSRVFNQIKSGKIFTSYQFVKDSINGWTPDADLNESKKKNLHHNQKITWSKAVEHLIDFCVKHNNFMWWPSFGVVILCSLSRYMDDNAFTTHITYIQYKKNPILTLHAIHLMYEPFSLPKACVVSTFHSVRACLPHIHTSSGKEKTT